MKKLLLLFVSLFFAFSGANTLAFTGDVNDELTIKIPIEDDYYAAGGEISIENNIDGDLIIAGGEIDIKGDVKEDLLILGGKINIEGKVGDDARLAGGQISIENNIDGDLIIAGVNVNIKKSVVIGGDLIVLAGRLKFEGDVKGKAKIETYNLTLNGNIDGNVDLKAEKIVIGENAKINGNLNYKSKKENLELKNIVSGETSFKKFHNKEKIKDEVKEFINFHLIIKLLSLFIFAGLIYLFLQNFWSSTSKYLKENIGKSFFIGFLIFATIPFAILFLLISVIGIPFGLFLLFMYIFLFVFYELFGTIVFSSLIIEKLGGAKKLQLWKRLLIVLGVAVLFVIITGIDIIAAMFAYGAIYAKKIEILKKIK